MRMIPLPKNTFIEATDNAIIVIKNGVETSWPLSKLWNIKKRYMMNGEDISVLDIMRIDEETMLERL